MVFDWFQRRTSEQPVAPAQESETDGADSQQAIESDVPQPEAPLEASDPAEPSTESAAQPLSTPPTAASNSSEPPAPPPASSASVDDDPLEWARQAYARLKAQQAQESAAQAEQADTTSSSASSASASSAPASTAEPSTAAPVPTASLSTQAVSTQTASLETDQADQNDQLSTAAVPVAEQASPQPVSPQPASEEPPKAAAPGLSLLEQAAAQRQERREELEARATTADVAPSVASTPTPQPSAPKQADQPQLGDFDDTFTWSAEVLAAQGRQVDQVSLEEIDWLGRLRQGLEKTRQGFVTGLLDSLGDDPLTPEVVDDLEALLLRADAGVQATDQVMEALRQRLNEEVVDPSEGIRFLKEQLRSLLDQPINASGVELLAPERGRLNIWLMVGVNGVGKTTTLGKLANLAVRSGYSAMIAAADTFRAAAVQQVEVWGERSDVPVVANPTANADPAAVVFDAIGAARSKNTDLLLVDTAGRLQTKHNLMEELQKIRRIVDRLAPESKVESLLVLDASQGQNGLKQAMAFAKAADLTGVVITKLDGTARGGVALAVSSEAELPIRFIGAGEGIRDLRPFNSFEFVEALLAGR